jgi:hypothetical protein
MPAPDVLASIDLPSDRHQSVLPTVLEALDSDDHPAYRTPTAILHHYRWLWPHRAEDAGRAGPRCSSRDRLSGGRDDGRPDR